MKLPEDYIESMRKLLGEEELQNYLDCFDAPRTYGLRVNTGKISVETFLKRTPFHLTPVPWVENGFYYDPEEGVTKHPDYYAGLYYIQEPSAMVPASRLPIEEGDRVLDLCAAPGGKSTELAARLRGTGLLVSNDISRSRAQGLLKNLELFGAGNILVTSETPESLFGNFEGFFDKILVDAPCSGEGMFRKDEKAIMEWSENNLRLCEERQKRILSDVWDALAPGGYLVYSTCTYNPGENEDILNWILTTFDASSVEIRHNFTAITPSPFPLHGYHFYPHKTSGEGLFMGVIQKNDGTPFTMKKEKRATPSPAVKLPADILPFLPDMTKYTPYIAGETLGILPKQHAEFIQYLSSKAGVIYKGCEIGECIKGRTKPAHSLALYHKLQQKHVIRQEVDLATALQFLRKEDIRFEAPQGEWILITYKGIGLGWVKEVGNRVNNYYPKEWRIKNLIK